MTATIEQFLATIKKREARPHGIGLAVNYAKSIVSCFGDKTCAAKFDGAASWEDWQQAMTKAADALVYRNDECEPIKAFTSSTEITTPKSCMEFDCILTSTKKDRDGDVLESGGAKVDQKMPLLLQHLPMLNIGKYLRTNSQDKKALKVRFAIADTELGNDAAFLVEFGSLRLSHGFLPEDFEPLRRGKGNDDVDGWLVKVFEVMEGSLVSIPSNTDGIVTAFSRSKLHHPLLKQWAKNYFDARPTTVKGGWEGSGGDGASATDPAAPPVHVTVNIGRKKSKSKDACACDAQLKCPSCGSTDVGQSRCNDKKRFCGGCGEMWIDGGQAGNFKHIEPARTKLWRPYVGIPYFASSYEWMIDQLEDRARESLAASGAVVKPRDTICSLGTFADHAVIAHFSPGDWYEGYQWDGDYDEDDGYTYYRGDWSMVDGRPTWSGSFTKVELTVEIRKNWRDLFMKAIKSGRAVSKKNEALLKEADDLVKEVKNDHRTVDEHRVKLKECSDHLKKGYTVAADSSTSDPVLGKDGPTLTKEAQPVGVKASKVLSAERLAAVESAHKMCDDLVADEKMSRMGKSTLKEARGYMKEVMDACKTGDANPEAEVTGEANPGVEEPKSLDDLATKVIGKCLAGDAMAPAIAGSLKEVAEEQLNKAAEKTLEAAIA